MLVLCPRHQDPSTRAPSRAGVAVAPVALARDDNAEGRAWNYRAEALLHARIETRNAKLESALTIRPATAADIPRLVALERHAVTAAHWAEADYQRLFAAGGVERLALVLEEGEVVAFIVARGAGVEWEIENVAVAGSARRRGLGTRLLGELLNRLRARGAASVFLEVRESNHAARSLYEKRAFEEQGRRAGYYRQPAEDAIVYRLSFPQVTRC